MKNLKFLPILFVLVTLLFACNKEDTEAISLPETENYDFLNSSEEVTQEMINFAKSRIEEYRLDDVYVMDIAEIENDYKLIECNCFNGTGFYKHNIERIVSAINNYIRKSTK